MADYVRSRLGRFVKNGGRNATVTYHYATALWKEHRQHPEAVPIEEVESLLMTALALRPDYADARLQLGIVYHDQQRYAEAVDQYRKALKIAPGVATTHYRLGQALARMGDKSGAQQAFAAYEKLRPQEVAATQKQSADIQQFVYTMRDASGTATRPK
jgi:tetratricopeptide (TPR) repeat protein